MKVVQGTPPNIKDIKAVFGAKALARAVFTYGDTVYIPKGTALDNSLEAHEATHIKQQGDKPQEWWDRYLADPRFRLVEEIEAYRVQYQYAEEFWNRAQRRNLLRHIIKSLSGPLYGNIISAEDAEAVVRAR